MSTSCAAVTWVQATTVNPLMLEAVTDTGAGSGAGGSGVVFTVVAPAYRLGTVRSSNRSRLGRKRDAGARREGIIAGPFQRKRADLMWSGGWGAHGPPRWNDKR